MLGLFGKKKAAFDVAEGNRHVAPGLELVAAGNGQGLGELYAGLPPADRLHFLDGVGQLTEIGAPLPALDSHPAIYAIAGGLHYVWAHRLRGFATADRTSHDQVMNMAEMAAVAEDLLDAAVEFTPRDSALHGFRFRRLTLTGGREGEADAVTADLRASGEANVLAELARMNYLAPKWHGSVGEMHAAAETAMDGAPNASFLALKARAWIEEWLYQTAMNDEADEIAAFRAKVKSDAFKAEVGALDDEFRQRFNNGPELSFAEASFAHNNLAVLFVLFADKARLKPHLTAIGSHAAQTPWGYVAGRNVPRMIDRKRAECGLPKLKG
ncbi:hypothetical protein K1X12_02265 [Hyphomonas sp. WL0036]|uniref:hypothetical protein n=1 Tax=Hyphomonas sediminis TaxID=2866160 RepID=UPI001C81417C|nr:hypothetical protein [Hyphomonas sediminis]MBY9065704.1 hypothetical protein [Hyphomonas sediminis]